MIVTFTGSSGSGQTTLSRRFLDEYPEAKIVLSHTTRSRRNTDGTDYVNVTHQELHRMYDSGELLWRTPKIFGNFYGTAKKDILAFRNDTAVMTLSPNVLRILHDFCQGEGIRVISFFIWANDKTRERRLRGRGETEDSIRIRVEESKDFLDNIKSSGISFTFINNDQEDGSDHAFGQIRQFFEYFKRP